MLALGLRATLNTDDPSISDTTLTDEYLIAVTAMGLDLEQMRTLVFNAVDAALLPAEEKLRLREELAAWESSK
jgi:adenosine deaminase